MSKTDFHMQRVSAAMSQGPWVISYLEKTAALSEALLSQDLAIDVETATFRHNLPGQEGVAAS